MLTLFSIVFIAWGGSGAPQTLAKKSLPDVGWCRGVKLTESEPRWAKRDEEFTGSMKRYRKTGQVGD